MSARVLAMPVVRWVPARTAVASASFLMLLAIAASDARAQGGTLDAPMHPIDKSDTSPSRCTRCPAADSKELDAQRVAERSAPEYPGARRMSAPEMEPSENPGAGLAGGAQLPPITLPLR